MGLNRDFGSVSPPLWWPKMWEGAEKRPSLGGKARFFSVFSEKTGVNLLMLGPDLRFWGGPGVDFGGRGGRNGVFGGSGAWIWDKLELRWDLKRVLYL